MGTALEPLVYAITLGTSSQQVLPSNPTRRGVVFINPSNTQIALCPALNNNSQPVAAVIGGAGSLTIAAGTVITVPPVAWIDAVASCAWNAVAAAGSTPFTIWEF